MIEISLDGLGGQRTIMTSKILAVALANEG